MNDNFIPLIKEAIKLELNVSDLYLLFYRQFPEDSHFWWQLTIEEQNHAALLKTLLQMTGSDLQLTSKLLPGKQEELVQANNRLEHAITEFKNIPDRTRAFQFAFEIENSAGEMHYDSFMRAETHSSLMSVFKNLNGDDINHADRIRQYMIKHQIPEAKESDTGL